MADGTDIQPNTTSGRDLARYILMRLIDNHEEIEKMEEDFYNDPQIILGIVDFFKDVRWIEQDLASGSYQITEKGKMALNITEKKTVMICDDERDLLELFGLALKSKYNVIQVSSGEDCIEKFIEEKSRGNKIHLILLDYRLSGMLGDSVAQKINEYGGTKIILISAYDLDYALVKDLEEKNYIVKYVEKPIHLNSLIDIVSDTIS